MVRNDLHAPCPGYFGLFTSVCTWFEEMAAELILVEQMRNKIPDIYQTCPER